MWVPGSLVFLIPAIVVTVRLLSPADLRRAKTALTTEASTVPGAVRSSGDTAHRCVPARTTRPARLAGNLLVLAAAVIADGLLGHQMAAMNLAGVLPWTYWRFFVIVGLLAVGNVFCMACPFMLPRELGRRLGLATRHWPRAAAIEVAGRHSAGALLLGLRGARAVEQPALDRVDRRRLFRRRLHRRHAVPRRQLLQVRLPDRAIPFRELARLAVRGAPEATEYLRHLRHARLPAWQRPAARM